MVSLGRSFPRRKRGQCNCQIGKGGRQNSYHCPIIRVHNLSAVMIFIINPSRRFNSIYSTFLLKKTSLEELCNAIIIIKRSDFRYIYISSASFTPHFINVELTLIRPHNHHRPHTWIDAVLLIRVAVPGVVVLVVDVSFVKICNNDMLVHAYQAQ